LRKEINKTKRCGKIKAILRSKCAKCALAKTQIQPSSCKARWDANFLPVTPTEAILKNSLSKCYA